MTASRSAGNPRWTSPGRRGCEPARNAGSDENVTCSGTLERAGQRHRLEERDAHGVDVALDLVGGGAEQPLGGHVHRGAGAVAHLLGGGDLQVAAQAEVAEVDALGPAVVQQDVRRLDVAMGDPLGVGAGQGLGGLDEDPRHGPQVLRLVEGHQAMDLLGRLAGEVGDAGPDDLAERDALDVRHGHEVVSVDVAQLVDRQERRAGQAAAALGLAAELGHAGRVMGQATA